MKNKPKAYDGVILTDLLYIRKRLGSDCLEAVQCLFNKVRSSAQQCEFTAERVEVEGE